VSVGEAELKSFIDEINWVYPALSLSPEDVTLCNAGLVPFGENDPNAKNLRYGKRSHLIDHERTHGLKGLVTLIGIRYTMARGDGARAVDLICRTLGESTGRPETEYKPVCGGDIDDFERLVRESALTASSGVAEATLRALIHNHGTAYNQVLRYAEHNPSLLETLKGSTVLKAEVINAVRMEMAQNLADVVLRRTDLGTGGDPGEEALRDCAALVARELGWPAARTERELQGLKAHFARLGLVQSSSTLATVPGE
jgi:glycerol-3-phosphate dehydrogenase